MKLRLARKIWRKCFTTANYLSIGSRNKAVFVLDRKYKRYCKRRNRANWGGCAK